MRGCCSVSASPCGRGLCWRAQGLASCRSRGAHALPLDPRRDACVCDLRQRSVTRAVGSCHGHGAKQQHDGRRLVCNYTRDHRLRSQAATSACDAQQLGAPNKPSQHGVLIPTGLGRHTMYTRPLSAGSLDNVWTTERRLCLPVRHQKTQPLPILCLFAHPKQASYPHTAQQNTHVTCRSRQSGQKLCSAEGRIQFRYRCCRSDVPLS